MTKIWATRTSIWSALIVLLSVLHLLSTLLGVPVKLIIIVGGSIIIISVLAATGEVPMYYSISYLLLQLPVVSQESQKPPSPQLILVCPLSALLTLWSSVFFDSSFLSGYGTACCITSTVWL